jgi:hypothetical protein
MVGVDFASLLIDERDVVDLLWGDMKARRQVRVMSPLLIYWIITNWMTQLGKWIHAHEVPSLEDILSNPVSIPYTAEVNEALQPYVDSLRKLLRSLELADTCSVPAMGWLGQRDPL